MDGAELLVQLSESTPWANMGAGKNKRAVHNATRNGRPSKENKGGAGEETRLNLLHIVERLRICPSRMRQF